MADLRQHDRPRAAPLNCMGCGRILQIRGNSPHPSERLCGWCVQRLQPQARRRRKG